MIRLLLINSGGLFLVLWATASPVAAQSSWHLVKLYLKPDVRIVQESEDILRVVHPAWPDTLTLSIGSRPDSDICPDSDIYGMTERRRGSNPYRVWVATHRFWDNPARPRHRWGQYFRASFLQLIRPPITTHAGFPDP